MSLYERPKKLDEGIQVGALTFAALPLLIPGITLAGGDKGILFQKTATVKALLFDGGGLKKGGSVTMGEVIVGRVTHMSFVDPSKGNLIEVTMEIRSDVRNRIKTDSVPFVRTQGILGNRYLDISIGSAKAQLLQPSMRNKERWASFL